MQGKKGIAGVSSPPSKIEGLSRVGLVSTDPLRVLGLQTVLGRLGIDVVSLSVPRALDIDGLSIILIDSDATTHLFELLAAFAQKRPKLRLIVLGLESSHEYIGQIIGAGAKGYLRQNTTELELIQALGVVHEGSAWAPRKVMADLLEQARGLHPASPVFTERELAVLRLLVQGHPNRQIGKELGVNEATVKAHVTRLMRKVGVVNRTALTLHALHADLGPSS
jgi:DNA-binding NarL/FixJ family response regulator